MVAGSCRNAMTVKGKVVVVTGGAEGIGRALCRRFAAEGARAVVVVDINAEGANTVAAEIGGSAAQANVACEAEIIRPVETVTARHGPIDLFCSNAGS
jgi:NAD(P)-dependent dehydrogenase (short-subunit alcohol dehydrogenase family)